MLGAGAVGGFGGIAGLLAGAAGAAALGKYGPGALDKLFKPWQYQTNLQGLTPSAATVSAQQTLIGIPTDPMLEAQRAAQKALGTRQLLISAPG